ncbi:MAG: DEAD/DEAH box helicase [Gammaproteobacteria bacterium]|nr:DEAD/DEAH box helicase [Gammaproteobacteria bacterium]
MTDLESFTEPARIWFREAFTAPTPVQKLGWRRIAQGSHTLLVAPTGSGKTLAAFLWGIDQLTRLPLEAAAGVRVLYVSPLKALVYDVERNLRAPLVGIQRTAERLGTSMRELRVDVRTGDTTQQDRRQQARDPADILVTTPESLFLLLGSKARETLRSVHTVIVDEVHALAPTKRGTHLLLSLERLSELADTEPQRMGLSATVRPLDEIAGFLGGVRPVEVVDTSEPPSLELQVTVPVPDMENIPTADTQERSGGSILGELYAREVGTPATERGIWPAIYPKLLESIRENRSTIIFVNSRGLCERLSQRLNELAGEELVLAHHGSVSHRRRTEIEEGLKRGTIRGIVATSSLELGIDMGAVDLVVLVESPGSVARGLQRVGRAGHQVGAISAGRIFPKFRGDLLECAVIAQRMQAGSIEALRAPRNVLDVLAQQLVALCCDGARSVAEIAQLVRRAYPFRQLSDQALHSVLDMLTGRYPSAEFADLRPLLSWDHAQDVLSARRGAAMVSRMNAGTIPDRGNYAVHMGEDGPRIGELDEEMVFETRAGDNILLGATTWHVEGITRDRVIVTPAPGEPGRLPFWRGDGPGRPVELGQALGAFTRRLGGMSVEAAASYLIEQTPLDSFAAHNLATYVHEQKRHTGTLPTDRGITVERFRDELGDWRVCILTPFGARIHGPWAMALQQLLAARAGFEIQVMYTDDGIVLRFADTDELPELQVLMPDPDEVEELVTEQLGDTALFAGLFRENAVRSLLLPRRRPEQRNPLWAQRLKSKQLLATARQFESFPVVLETYRQALSDVFDVPGLRALLRRIGSREIQVSDVETRSASPFARSLVFAYVAAYIYEQDSPIAERRAQALTLDRNLLGELLGQAELRELIDSQVLTQLEAELQQTADDFRARDADELHDALRRLGDLEAEELTARCESDPAPWLHRLTRERRVAAVTVAGQRRWIAAEDAALFRDALGCMPPAGLPDSLLVPVEDAMQQLLRRYARHRGPFTSREPAVRYGLQPAQVEPALRILEAAGTLVRGEIRPGGSQLEWCDAEVLRRLKRLTLAKLRRTVAPVDAQALGSFLPRWHGIQGERQGPDRLLEVIGQLQGLPLPWSSLNSTILPQRVTGFTPDLLDMASATGLLVWVGCSALGSGDGRIALYRRDQAGLLLRAAPYSSPGAIHEQILTHLAHRGASFLMQLEDAVHQGHSRPDHEEFTAALWDLVWSGQITNDTFAPLRSLGRRRSRSHRGHTLAGGRWSLVSTLIQEASDTEKALAQTRVLLERYGVVSREMAQFENLPGGFGPLYRVLKTMEDAGKVRRGYFVEGLSGAQFGHVGAVDRLRAARPDPDPVGPCADEDVLTLAAVDPANPYGAVLPWPANGANDEGRPRRVPGAWVILVDGKAVLYLGPGGRQLLTFPETAGEQRGELKAALRALHQLPRGARRGLLTIRKIDGVPVNESPHLELLRECGFERDYRGVTAMEFHR